MLKTRSDRTTPPIGLAIGLLFTALFSMIFWPSHLRAESPMHHDLVVSLLPNQHRLTVTDTITLPKNRPEHVIFRLHPDLVPTSPTTDVRIESVAKTGWETTYRTRVPTDQRQLTLRYSGRVYHELEPPDQRYARGIPRTQGQISEAGVYLSGSSRWYPDFGSRWVTFSLRVQTPDGWRTVSQGRRVRHDDSDVTWSAETPQEQIYLVAGRYEEFTRPAGEVEAMVFLRRDDPRLARSYLEATARYIQLYSDLIGPYPYTKFALVENFWETGFGMPSFTLLGPRVIRFPFILHSSYPHEILHNWWGNSVYPVYEKGNWAEGLTAYMADHLIKEQRGRDAEYRQTVLQKYRDYVSRKRDLALVDFTGRHSSATEAVGYGKGMMFFHMLRRQLGDPTFKKTLQAFYRNYKFARAAYADIQRTMEAVSGVSLETEFDQWVSRVGGPELVIEGADMQLAGGRYRLRATLLQKQANDPYHLRIPMAVTLENDPRARMELVSMDRRRQTVELIFDKRPMRLDVDPGYDLFRKLDRREVPPALSQLFGARKITIVLPAAATEQRLAAYRRFTRRLQSSGPETSVAILDRDLDGLPSDRSVVVLGWSNRFRAASAKALNDYGVKHLSDGVAVAKQTLDPQNHSVVLTTRHPANPEQVLVWIAAGPDQALPGLARKLPHYHKYSYLAFTGNEPRNVAKGRWPVYDSPMTVLFGGEKEDRAALPPKAPLAIVPADDVK